VVVRSFFSLAALQVICGTALASLLGGCLSVSYVDSNNRRHVIGFVDVAVEQAAPGSATPELTIVRMTTVGIHVYSGAPEGSGLAIGYVQGTTMLMPDNSCVSLERPGACRSDAPEASVDPKAKEPKS
jgi:hypothetical protein